MFKSPCYYRIQLVLVRLHLSKLVLQIHSEEKPTNIKQTNERKKGFWKFRKNDFDSRLKHQLWFMHSGLVVENELICMKLVILHALWWTSSAIVYSTNLPLFRKTEPSLGSSYDYSIKLPVVLPNYKCSESLQWIEWGDRSLASSAQCFEVLMMVLQSFLGDIFFTVLLIGMKREKPSIIRSWRTYEALLPIFQGRW